MTLTYAELSRRISRAFQERGEWAGVPMPLPGLGLVLESKHPGAAMIAEVQKVVDANEPPPAPTMRVCRSDDLGWQVVNRWRGRLLTGVTGTVFIARHEDGRTTWGIESDKMKRNAMLLGPLSTFDAWHLDTELTAIDRLATLLTERMFAAYLLTGSFLETSKRSGLTYFFRRCRPTIVLTPRGGAREYFYPDDDDHGMRILVCLCLHPLAYYANTFAGAMVPTDDVIAHLMLMRGDERLFWRRANHHHPLEPESGL